MPIPGIIAYMRVKWEFCGYNGIVRIYQPIIISTKKQYHALLCFGVSGRYTTNCYPDAQTVGATNSGTLTPLRVSLTYVIGEELTLIHKTRFKHLKHVLVLL